MFDYFFRKPKPLVEPAARDTLKNLIVEIIKKPAAEMVNEKQFLPSGGRTFNIAYEKITLSFEKRYYSDIYYLITIGIDDDNTTLQTPLLFYEDSMTDQGYAELEKHRIRQKNLEAYKKEQENEEEARVLIEKLRKALEK